MSHTAKCKVSYNNIDVLAKTVEAMGGRVLGQGSHKLYAGPETGWGFQLKGWQYPIVLTASGELCYDDYHGDWGDVKDLERLKEHYAIGVAQSAAAAQGWYSEVNDQGELVVFHPSGGTLTISKNGTVDAANFIGASCVEAGAIIENAMGRTISTQNKPELLMARARVTELA